MAMGGGARLGPCPCSCPSTWFASSLRRSLRRFTVLPAPPLPLRRYCHFAVRQDSTRSSNTGLFEDPRCLGHSGVAPKRSEGEKAWAVERHSIQLRKARHDVLNGLTDGRILLPSIGSGNLDPALSLELLNGTKNTVPRSLTTKSSDLDMNLPQSRDFSTPFVPSDSASNRLVHTIDAESRCNVANTVKVQISPTKSEEHVSVQFDSKINGAGIVNGVKQVDLTDSEKLHGGYRKSHYGSDEKISGDVRKELAVVYDEVLVINNIELAREVVEVLRTKYKDFVHACDTEVSNIDVKEETPVGHGEVICFSICPGNNGERADFGDGKSCIWVDILEGGREVLMEFAPFFEDSSIKKVWHNYSFDSHIIENYGIKLSGFYADTMHLARLWNSSRRADGGYSLEALSGDPNVMCTKFVCRAGTLHIGKVSMKTIFGKKKPKKDGSEGKITIVDPVEMLQKKERKLWICYSALDSICTLGLFESLRKKLLAMEWNFDGCLKGTMYEFYLEYWRPFGALLAKMESEGMLVDREHLSAIEKVATTEQQLAADKFRRWASKYCPDAKYMNVGSDTQIRQLFFGGTLNRKNQNEELPVKRTFIVPNTEYGLSDGKKTSKNRTIELWRICDNKIETDMYTAGGWPSMCGDALRSLAGKISADLVYATDDRSMDGEASDSEVLYTDEEAECSNGSLDCEDTSSYGSAYNAFSGGKAGKEACHAIAALCEVSSIDKLISGFIRPLQGNHISCSNGRIHCSLNINTETGRLSARTPNLQNQPALEKDRYKIRQAFVAAPGKSLIVADYGQLELRILAHLADCKSMLDAFKAGGDFHSRTAMNMYEHIRRSVEDKKVLLEWHPQNAEDRPPVPLLKDAFAAERRKAKMLNFSIAYGKTVHGLAKDWKVSIKEAKETRDLWYRDREEVLLWQEDRKKQAAREHCVYTLLGRARQFPNFSDISYAYKSHIERAAINTPVQGSAADVAMCAMLEIDRNTRLRELGWTLLLQVHDEVILEGPAESAELAKSIVVECMSKPFYGKNILKVDLSVDAKCAQNWYAAK